MHRSAQPWACSCPSTSPRLSIPSPQITLPYFITRLLPIRLPGNTAHSLSQEEGEHARPRALLCHCCAPLQGQATSHNQLQTREAAVQLACGVMNSWTRWLRSLPGNLTLVDVESPLGHVAHPSLRLLAAECVEVVDIRGFIRDFKIADTAVTLRTKTSRCPR